MRLSILAVGKQKDTSERDLVQKYEKRIVPIARGLGFTRLDIRELNESRAPDAIRRKSDEADRLLVAAGDDSVVVALDERGDCITSEAFAQRLENLRDQGRPTLSFLIGGPDGHGAAVLDRADLKLSLGLMTLPHGLARVILVEQIYRAMTILAGHPYHRS